MTALSIRRWVQIGLLVLTGVVLLFLLPRLAASRGSDVIMLGAASESPTSQSSPGSGSARTTAPFATPTPEQLPQPTPTTTPSSLTPSPGDALAPIDPDGGDEEAADQAQSGSTSSPPSGTAAAAASSSPSRTDPAPATRAVDPGTDETGARTDDEPEPTVTLPDRNGATDRTDPPSTSPQPRPEPPPPPPKTTAPAPDPPPAPAPPPPPPEPTRPDRTVPPPPEPTPPPPVSTSSAGETDTPEPAVTQSTEGLSVLLPGLLQHVASELLGSTGTSQSSSASGGSGW